MPRDPPGRDRLERSVQARFRVSGSVGLDAGLETLWGETSSRCPRSAPGCCPISNSPYVDSASLLQAFLSGRPGGSARIGSNDPERLEPTWTDRDRPEIETSSFRGTNTS